jgi:putative DNA primase/helicase
MITLQQNNFNQIPQELIERNQWVAWKGEIKDSNKMTKIPIDPHTGSYAKANDSNTWSSFDEAVACCRENKLNGIGFVFTEKDPFVGIDFDNCIHPDGTVHPEVQKLIQTLRSYTEISPSGKGVHVIAKGKLPGSGRRNGLFEIYADKRVFTVTGNKLPEASDSIEDREEIISRLYKGMPAAHNNTVDMDIENLIHKAMTANNGEKFKTLWHGHTSGYPSESEADLALAQILAFWSDGNAQKIDLLFRKSGLYRPKWDEPHYQDGKTYGEITVQKAVQSMAGRFQPMVKTSAVKNHLEFKNTDLGNAERLVHHFGDSIRYCHAWKSWMIWDGIRWKMDETDQIKLLAKKVVRMMYDEARDMNDDDKRRALIKHAMSSESEYRFRSMINLAQSEVAITPQEFDKNQYLLNCNNGTIDLRTGRLLPHRKENFITKLAPVAFDEKAISPLWDKFLKKIMNNNPSMISFLQRAIGYSLTGDISEQCLFIFWGSGANGKSTFLNTIGNMLGDYAQQTPTETLMVKRQGALSNDVARLKGARFVTASEAEGSHTFAESLLKQMTGGEQLSARFLYQETFSFYPSHKIFLGTNHKPDITNLDAGIWRRLNLVEFNITIPEEERDKHLVNKLQEEISGILNWAIKGCLDWQRHGLCMPEEVKKANAEYRNEMDIISDFISDCFFVGPGYEVLTRDLYTRYIEWCEKNGDKAMSKRVLMHRFREKGFQPFRSSKDGARGWKGLCLK